jgi:hypothetical protein
LPSWRFAPNHQNYWSWNHPYSLPMPLWNSSPGMHGYHSYPYFDPWYESLYYGGLPNHFAYQWLSISRAELLYFSYAYSCRWIHMADTLLSPLA